MQMEQKLFPPLTVCGGGVPAWIRYYVNCIMRKNITLHISKKVTTLNVQQPSKWTLVVGYPPMPRYRCPLAAISFFLYQSQLLSLTIHFFGRVPKKKMR